MFREFSIYLTEEHHVGRSPDGALELSSQDGQSVLVDQVFQDEDEASGENAESQEDKDAGDGRDAEGLRAISVVSRTGAREGAVPFAAQLVHVAGRRVAGNERGNARL